MQTSLMKTLAARTLLRATAGSMLAAGRPGDAAKEATCRWCRPVQGEGDKGDSVPRPIVSGRKLEVTRHGR